MDLGLLLTSLTTGAALIWAGVAYLIFGWADRLLTTRTPAANAAILIGGGFVAPVIVLAALLALTLPWTTSVSPTTVAEHVIDRT